MKNIFAKLFWPVILLILTFTLGFVASFFEYQRIDQANRQDLIQFTDAVRASLDIDLINSFAGDISDLQNPNYLKFRQYLVHLSDTYPHAKYLYLMKLVNNQVKFIIDSQSSHITTKPDLALPGEAYPEAKNTLLELFSKKSIITVGPESDSWGSFVSGLSSVTNQEGRIIAVVGIDIDSTMWSQQIYRQLYGIFGFFVTLYVAELLLFFQVIRYRQHQNTLSYLATVLDYSTDAIISYDLAGTIKSWNHGATTIFGYTEAEALGKKIIDLIYPANKKFEFNLIISTAQLGQVKVQKETVRRDKAGKLHHLLISWSPLYQDGQVIGISTIAKDVTADSLARQTLLDRNSELEKLNLLLVNRELKMIELKNKIKELASHQ